MFEVQESAHLGTTLSHLGFPVWRTPLWKPITIKNHYAVLHSIMKVQREFFRMNQKSKLNRDKTLTLSRPETVKSTIQTNLKTIAKYQYDDWSEFHE